MVDPTLSRPLDVRDLPADGLQLAEDLSEETLLAWVGDALARGPVPVKLLAGGHAKVEIRPIDEGTPPTVRLRGRIAAELDTQCVRCLEPVRCALDAELDATLVPAAPAEPPPVEPTRGRAKGKAIPVKDGEPLEPWDESFPAPEALGEDAYDGRTLPLPNILGEALLIEVPSDPACENEDACDERTQALIASANAEARASEEEGDPRWAALRALRGEAEDPKGKD